MKLNKPEATILVPDGTPTTDALERVTHLGIGAHPDDLEIMAYDGIAECLHDPQKWFGGVTCTAGGGSAREGDYAHYSDAEMRRVRRLEQEQAAHLGQYGIMVQLGYESEELGSSVRDTLRAELVEILKATSPSIVYTHNPADKHATHIDVLTVVMEAMKALPPQSRPPRLLGCEVWRGLDWMLDEDKVALDVGAHESLAQSLVGLFDSQIAGGKRYDLATAGRRLANATYYNPHASDRASRLWFAMDLTPLLKDDSIDLADYAAAFIDRFRDDVVANIERASRGSRG